MVEYILQILRRVLLDTTRFFEWNWRKTVVSIFYVTFGSIIYLWLYGKEGLLDELPIVISFIVVPIGILVLLLLMHNLIMAPLKVERSKIHSRWEGSRYVPSRLVEKHILIKVSHAEPIICTLPCPPNSLAQIRHEIPHYLGNVFLAIRQVGTSDVPSLSGSGIVEVIVNQDSQVEFIAIPQAGLNTGNVPITIGLLGWTES